MTDEKYIPSPILDPDTMTVGEFVAFEEVTGYSMEETVAALVRREWAESATVLLATMLISGARERPNAWTIEDAARISFVDLVGVGDAVEEEAREAVQEVGRPDVISVDLDAAPDSVSVGGTSLIQTTPSPRVPDAGDHSGHCHAIAEDPEISASRICCLPAFHTGPHEV